MYQFSQLYPITILCLSISNVMGGCDGLYSHGRRGVKCSHVILAKKHVKSHSANKLLGATVYGYIVFCFLVSLHISFPHAAMITKLRGPLRTTYQSSVYSMLSVGVWSCAFDALKHSLGCDKKRAKKEKEKKE